MEEKAALAALDAITNGVNLLRLSILGNGILAPRRASWATEDHVDEIVARLGMFETAHIEAELQVGNDAARSRIKSAIKRGTVVEVHKRSNYSGAVYRWTGKT